MLLSGLIATGCGRPVGLGEIMVEGGTEEQQQLVRQTMLDFERQAGAGRITLRAVEFDEEGSGGNLGMYLMEAQTIYLSPSLSLDVIEVVTRHELCHALDLQEDLSTRSSGALDDLTDAILDYELDDVNYVGPDARRIETFAQLCEEGPQVASLLRGACSDIAPSLSDSLAWMTSAAWRGGVWFPPATAPAVERSWEAPYDLDLFLVVPQYLDGAPVFWVQAYGPGLDVDVHLDPETGDELIGVEQSFEQSDFSFDEEPEDLGGVTVTTIQGWEDGPQIALAEAGVDNIGPFRRVISREGSGDWHRVPGQCPAEDVDVVPVALDGRVWIVWADGGTLRWGHIDTAP